MPVRFFDPGKSYLKIKPEIDAAMQDVLARGDLILRKDLEEFEASLAKYLGVKYVVGVASGTDALTLALVAAGLQEGDKVLAPSYTFRATIEAIYHLGGDITLYDHNSPITLGDADFFVPAHIGGEVTEHAKKAMALAQQFNVIVIEDSAQAIGAHPLMGLAACYSFYPAKILGCYGDGGAIATNDETLAQLLLLLRNHYKGSWIAPGYNSRLDNLQAAVLNVKLKYLPSDLVRRKKIALMYDENLKGVGLDTVRTHYQDYIITHPNRDRLKVYLATLGIETMENGYPFPKGFYKGPVTTQYEAQSLRIPCNPDLTNEEVKEVIDAINTYANPMS